MEDLTYQVPSLSLKLYGHMITKMPMQCEGERTAFTTNGARSTGEKVFDST